MDFNPRFMGQPGGFSPAGAGPNDNEEENNGRPPFEIVRHPDAPPQLPFAIKDNVNGGFVTGGSPLFPRVFSTPAEANDHVQNLLQQMGLDPGAINSFPMYQSGSNTTKSQATPASKPTKTASSQDGNRKLQKGIKATVFGGQWNNENSAYGYGPITDRTMGASLPADMRGAWVQITNPVTGKTVVVPIVDKGPWYNGTPQRPADKYWETGSRPRAESDKKTNGAGIDLTPATAHSLGLPYDVVRHNGVPVRDKKGRYLTEGGGSVDWQLVPPPAKHK